jgi:hypothetical protein
MTCWYDQKSHTAAGSPENIHSSIDLERWIHYLEMQTDNFESLIYCKVDSQYMLYL